MPLPNVIKSMINLYIDRKLQEKTPQKETMFRKRNLVVKVTKGNIKLFETETSDSNLLVRLDRSGRHSNEWEIC